MSSYLELLRAVAVWGLLARTLPKDLLLHYNRARPSSPVHRGRLGPDLFSPDCRISLASARIHRNPG
jgi:hypothetical protein